MFRFRTFARRALLALALPVLGLLPLASADAAAAPAALREALDVRYFPGDSDRHLLDVFAPRLAEGALAPVVLFVHGGTWMVGDKDFFGEYRGVGRFFARHGVVAILPNYRLSPGVKHPEHVKDVARAFAWARRHARAHGGDPNRIVLAGHSAGGHLASLLATDPSYLRSPADRAALRGVMSVCGVYRIPGPEESRAMMNDIIDAWIGENASGTTALLLGAGLRRLGKSVNPFNLIFGSKRDVQVQASPESHVRKGLPPFLVLHAEGEVPGLERQAQDFATALRRAGNVAELHRMPGTSHREIMLNINNPDDATGRALLDFVRRYAPPPRASS